MRRLALLLLLAATAGCLGTDGPGEQRTTSRGDPTTIDATATPTSTTSPTETPDPTPTQVDFGTSTADSQIRVHNDLGESHNVSVAVLDENGRTVAERTRTVPADGVRGLDVDAVEPPGNFTIEVTVDERRWNSCRWEREYHGEFLLVRVFPDQRLDCRSAVT